MMDIKQLLKEKINSFITNNNISATKSSLAPTNFQNKVLTDGFDDYLVEIFILSLIDDKETLKEFLGEELYFSKEFNDYCNDILGINIK